MTTAEEITGRAKSYAYDNFVNAIRSPAARQVYVNSLRRYMKHLRVARVDQLLASRDPRFIEAQLIDYIMSLRENSISHDTIKYLVTPIFTFYTRNDVQSTIKADQVEPSLRVMNCRYNIRMRNRIETMTNKVN
jgi:hypothetical protein